MLRYIKGYVRIQITGAEPFRVLNRFAACGLDFWQVSQKDELTVFCCLYERDCARAEQLALQTMCTVQKTEEHSFERTFGGLRRRLALLCGVVLAAALAMLLQEFVWTVEIEGNTEIPTQLLRQQLEEVGVKFGTWGPSLDQTSLKYQLINRVEKLAWVGVNRRGGRVTVTVTEREEKAENLDRRVFTDLIAVCPGIITKADVYNGFAAVKAGDAVLPGQLLVAGAAEWTTHTQITRAMGEIYAQTLRQKTFCMPAETAKKQYTGREFRQISVVLGRKRIKISGNSGISYPSCDKMINRKVCTLPGGYSMPFVIETVTYREYELTPEPVSEESARAFLTAYSENDIRSRMVGGTVLSRTDTLTEENGTWQLKASFYCEEMIARPRPGVMEETDGTDDQRRTD